MRWHLSLAARARLYGLQRKAATHKAASTSRSRGGEQAEPQPLIKNNFFFRLKAAATAQSRYAMLLLSCTESDENSLHTCVLEP